jgi:hypothetical protein
VLSSHAVLIHSPLTTASVWGELPEAMRALGWTVTVPEVVDDDPPWCSRFVALTAQQLTAAGVGDDVVLVGQGLAGPLLPQIAFARQAAGKPVGGYVFIDAPLPRTLRTASLLEVLEASDPVATADLVGQLADGGRYPDWTDGDLAVHIPDPGQRALLLAGVQPRPLEFFTERLPLTEDWPDAPCCYLQLTSAFAPEAKTAQLRGWPVRAPDAHPFWAMTDPEALAATLTELVSE